ncbi:unnamed protein product [Polarella glacialis]|uniref:Uncharacterized protein n=1 Tax=Polarella glacialis TaxID=89957 RepID=A0A813HIP6_POLGL|nr:unnamed protein product [Polarella glacialis]
MAPSAPGQRPIAAGSAPQAVLSNPGPVAPTQVPQATVSMAAVAKKAIVLARGAEHSSSNPDPAKELLTSLAALLPPGPRLQVLWLLWRRLRQPQLQPLQVARQHREPGDQLRSRGLRAEASTALRASPRPRARDLGAKHSTCQRSGGDTLV